MPTSLTPPAHRVYISQLIRYSKLCAQYSKFLDRIQLLAQKLPKQGCIALRLDFYGRHRELVDLYEISISQMAMDLFSFT